MHHGREPGSIPSDGAPTSRRGSPVPALLALVLVILFSYPVHEAGHWAGFALVGIPAAISFDHTYFTQSWQPSLVGAAGGPFVSVVLAWIGALLVARRGRLSSLGYALALVMPLTRLATYAVCAAVPRAMAVNDEGVMALRCGWPAWTFAWMLTPLLLGPWVVAWRTHRASPARKVGLFGSIVAAWVALALVLEVGIVDPWLFPAAAARELVMPHAPP